MQLNKLLIINLNKMKTLRFAGILLLTMILSFGMASCDDAQEDFTPEETLLEVNQSNVAGTWAYSYYAYTDVADDNVVMQLNSDGTMTTTYYDVDGNVKTLQDGSQTIYTGTWSLNGNTLTTTASDGTVATATIKWVSAKYLYVVLPQDATTGLKDQMMTYTRQ